MERQQEVSEEFYRSLLDGDAEKLYEQAPCGYASLAPEGTFVKVNQTLLTMTGYARDQLVGHRTFAELLTPGGRIYHETHVSPMLAMQGLVREVALELVAEDGRRIPVLVNATTEVGEDGAPLLIRLAVFDATERRKYERELLRAKQRAEASEAHAAQLAETLQQTLIPPTPPVIDGLDLAAAYRPAGDGREVGGDFYDIFQIGEGDWVVALGDVSGKGAEAAVVTALVRHSLRAITVRVRDPGEALHALNDVVHRNETERFCTIALLRIRCDEDKWSVTMSCGGHPPPVLVRAGQPPVPIGAPGSLIGAFEVGTYVDTVVDLQPGDMLVLYTDGVTEGRRGSETFGEDGLLVSIAEHAGSVDEVTGGLVGDVMDFQGGVPRDDIAVLALRSAPTA